MRNLSVYNKIFLIFSVSLLLTALLIGWFGVKNTSDAYISSAYMQSQQDTKTLKASIEQELKKVPKDILYATNFYALKRYFVWSVMGEDKKAREWKQIYSSAIVDFLDTQKDYYKARVIDLEGNEIISAEHNNISDTTSLTPENELQNKKGRAYVEKAKLLKKGELYISTMNLNIENGKIQKPYNPVIRYSTPIINANDELVGVFVVNVYAQTILNILESKEQSSESSHYFLVNQKGNYLFNADKEKMWNDQLKNGYSFNLEHGDIAKKFNNQESGIVEMNDKIYSFDKVYPLTGDLKHYWYVVSYIDKSIALSMLNNFKIIFFLIIFTMLLLSFFIVKYFIASITNPLSEVTKQLNSLSRGEVHKRDIIYNSQDEIGQIVQSTSKLVDAIALTISQAKAVSKGNFTKEITLLGNSDELGLAIESMTKRLKEMTYLAESLSRGNYDVQIIANSSEDKIGLALMDTVKYFSDITNIAESISLGNLDVSYERKGEEDRLGSAILQMIEYLRVVLKQANAIAQEDFTGTIEVKSKNDELGKALVSMTDILRDTSIKSKNEIYFSEGVGKFSNAITGLEDSALLVKEAISLMTQYVEASSGVLYSFDKETSKLQLIASYAYTERSELSNQFKLGEGVVGQVALEKAAILLKNVRDENLKIETGTTQTSPKEVYTLPLVHEGELYGVAEVMTLGTISSVQKEYLNRTAEILATTLYSLSQNIQIKTLLEKSQQAFEELQTQSEELQESNVQMEEQQQQLTLQSKQLQEKNDILAQAKAEIDKRADDLEKASKYKSEFLANMSHELRTPLNSIILLSKLLTQNQTKTLSQKDLEKSAVIHKAGNDLLLLINDILDLSKVESGNMELMNESIASAEIVDEMQGLFGAVAHEKGLAFSVEDSFNAAFITDKTKLAQVIKNLLSNALKFTKEGSVKLAIVKEDDKLKISVTDTGIGIPSDKLETVFEAFKQVDGSISREFGGTGLGLSISKTIVELMGGELSVSSEFGKGSTFYMLIPLMESDSQAVVQEKEKPEDQIKVEIPLAATPHFAKEDEPLIQAELEGKNILVVDDDSRNIFTLTSTLEDMDAEVYSALNGQEALDLLEENSNIDLILMDLMMPVMDGLEATTKIKQNEKLKHIPIVMVTAKSMPEDKEKCLASGADDYLTKPIDQNALISMIKAWID